MNDCSNAEMRDQLPDLLHDRLSAGARAELTAHLAECVDCREELELLRDLQAALAVRAPRIDTAWVANALPKPPAQVPARVAPRRTWADWRIAAAVTLLVAGGSSVVLVNRNSNPSSGTPTVNVVPVRSAQALADTPRAETGAVTASVASAEGLGMGGHLVDLDDDQLQELIDEIGQLKAVPNVEPEPVLMRIDPRGNLDQEIM